MTSHPVQWGETGMLRGFASIFSVTLIFTALLGAAPAAAQLAPGQSGHSSTIYVGSDEAWRALADFGRCYATRRTSKALELVSTPAGSIEEARTYKRLFKDGDNCLTLVDSMSIDFLMVRGVVAEGLYRQSIPVPAALAVTKAPTINEVKTFAEVALCYTGSNRAAVQELVATTKPGSKAEDEAVDRLIPGIATCIPEKARNLKLSSPLIRFRLAEALWRLGERPALAEAAK